MSTWVSPRAEVERLVLADFEQMKGRLIRTTEVECRSETDTLTMLLPEPVTLRIVGPNNPNQGLYRWMGREPGGSEWCDPAYDVELVESTPEADTWLADGDYHISWVYGPFRNTDGRYDKPRFKVLIGAT